MYSITFNCMLVYHLPTSGNNIDHNIDYVTLGLLIDHVVPKIFTSAITNWWAI